MTREGRGGGYVKRKILKKTTIIIPNDNNNKNKKINEIKKEVSIVNTLIVEAHLGLKLK